jgi:hypothetical protein
MKQGIRVMAAYFEYEHGDHKSFTKPQLSTDIDIALRHSRRCRSVLVNGAPVNVIVAAEVIDLSSNCPVVAPHSILAPGNWKS